MKSRPLHGFTLVELLVVIAIIGVLVGMMIPAIQASREMASRNLCHANLAQLMLAVQSYENAFESFPPGVLNPDGPIRTEPVGFHHGWLVQLLPYIDEGNAYRLLDLSTGAYDAKNALVRDLSPNVFICPSEPNDEPRVTSYAGCHHDVESPIDADNRGMLFLNSHIRREDVSDGCSHTLIAGEKRTQTDDLGWMSGTRATLRNTELPINDVRSTATANATEGSGAAPTFVGGFASAHTSGAYMGFADGSVKFVAENIDLPTWRLLGNRADGKLLHFNPRD